MQDVVIALIVCGSIVCCVLFVRQGVMALASRRPQGKLPNEPPGDLQGAVTALHEEVDGVRREVADLAERVDFAERMLAKQRDAERISPPKS